MHPSTAHVVFLLLCAVTTRVSTQSPFAGRCPTQNVVQNFNATAYVGRWYEQEKYFAIFQVGGKCVTADYNDEGNGVVGVNNTQISSINNARRSIQGTAQLTGKAGEAKLTVRFPSAGNFPANYWVLDTDYENHSVVWSCTNILGLFNTQFLWVLTREKLPSPNLMMKIRNILTERQLPINRLQKTVQNCPN